MLKHLRKLQKSSGHILINQICFPRWGKQKKRENK